MSREDALKRLAALLAERIKASPYADVIKPVQSFRDIPPESKFWALPTGEAVTWPRGGGPHHASVIEEMGFQRARSMPFPDNPVLHPQDAAIQAELIRGESGKVGSELSANIGQRPDTILAAMDLLRAHRPEFGWVDVTAKLPRRDPSQYQYETLPLRYEWSKSGDLMRKLTRLYEASKSPEQFLATLRAMRTMGLLPLAFL